MHGSPCQPRQHEDANGYRLGHPPGWNPVLTTQYPREVSRGMRLSFIAAKTVSVKKTVSVTDPCSSAVKAVSVKDRGRDVMVFC